MPYQSSTESKAAYVDVRFYLKKETEEWTDEDGNIVEFYENYDIDYIERKKIKWITEEDLHDMAESFGQVDDYHLFFQDEVPSAVAYGGTYRFRG